MGDSQDMCFCMITVRLLIPQIVKVQSRGKVHFTDAFCGAYMTIAVSKEGHVYGFGLSNYHQLGEHKIKMYLTTIRNTVTELGLSSNLSLIRQL